MSPDEAVVDELSFDRHWRPLMSANQAGIDAAHTDSRDIELATNAEYLSVHEAVEHHARDFHRFLVGHAPACNHARCDAERFLNLRQLRTAAVDKHDANAHLVQNRNLLDERTCCGGIAENATTRLDDEHLALVHADVRRGAAQRADGNGRISS